MCSCDALSVCTFICTDKIFFHLDKRYEIGKKVQADIQMHVRDFTARARCLLTSVIDVTFHVDTGVVY